VVNRKTWVHVKIHAQNMAESATLAYWFDAYGLSNQSWTNHHANEAIMQMQQIASLLGYDLVKREENKEAA
jgi:hypothetical protein